MDQSKRDQLKRLFGYFIAGIVSIKCQRQQEDGALGDLNFWLCEEPDEGVRYVMTLFHEELPGHITHPTVVTCLEFLEGMLAWRSLWREGAQPIDHASCDYE